MTENTKIVELVGEDCEVFLSPNEAADLRRARLDREIDDLRNKLIDKINFGLIKNGNFEINLSNLEYKILESGKLFKALKDKGWRVSIIHNGELHKLEVSE